MRPAQEEKLSDEHAASATQAAMLSGRVEQLAAAAERVREAQAQAENRTAAQIDEAMHQVRLGVRGGAALTDHRRVVRREGCSHVLDT